MHNFRSAIAATFRDRLQIVVAVSLAVNFLAFDYILLTQSTTPRIMADQNTALFNGAVIGLSLTTAVLFGLSVAMMLHIFRTLGKSGAEAAPGTLFGTLTAAVASGCPVCGAWLLPLLGIAGSLAVFPLQGLEIRLLAIALLAFSISRSAGIIDGTCVPRTAWRRYGTGFAVVAGAVAILFALPYLPDQYKLKFQQAGVSAPTVEQLALERKLELLPEQVLPRDGYTIDARYGNIGYQLVQAGVINFEKFTTLYDNAGSPLTADQLRIFQPQGLDAPITIDRDNAYFLLNLFWAVGLATENPILTDGQIRSYGNGRIGDFASTGGWTIATKPLEEIYAASQLAPLSDEQQALLQRVAENTYRPCCGNSTAFPDCNHGMALLGVLELLAARGASEDELYEAAKNFSAYWFPAQAFDLAAFFLVTADQSFADIDARDFVSERFFSGSGWSRVKGWLDANLGVTPQGGNGGGSGCGV